MRRASVPTGSYMPPFIVTRKAWGAWKVKLMELVLEPDDPKLLAIWTCPLILS